MDYLKILVDPLPDMIGTKYYRRNGTSNSIFSRVLRSRTRYVRTLNTGLDPDAPVVHTEHVNMLLYSRGQQISRYQISKPRDYPLHEKLNKWLGSLPYLI